MISEFRSGRVVGESFKMVFRHLFTIVPIALVCGLPMILVIDRPSRIQMERREAALRGARPERPEIDPMSMLASLSFYVTYPLACGAIAFAVHRSMRGERVSFFESLGAGLKRIFGLFGLFISSLLFMGMGFLPAILLVGYGVGVIPWLFLVPGVFLLLIPGFALVMMVYVAIPVCVIENKGVFASMRRSRELTAGYRWQLFVVMLCVAFLSYLISIVAGFFVVFGAGAVAPSSVGPQNTSPLMMVVVSAFTASFVAWTASATAVAYCHLRGFKEVDDADEVAKMFD